MKIKIVLGTVALLALLYPLHMGLLYTKSEAKLRDFKAPEPFHGALPTDVTSIENGRRLVQTRGCRSCHGENLGGEVLEWYGRNVAVNLTRYVRTHDLSTFEAAVRHGIGANGKAMTAMPSYMYQSLTDDDLLSIAAYLHSLPVVEDTLPKPKLDWKSRRRLVNGTMLHIPDLSSLAPAPRYQDSSDPLLAKGEYIAMTSCVECHGPDLRNWIDEGWNAADLAIVAGYPEEDFHRLMKEGVALGNRELPEMSGIARERFSDFNAEERKALHKYLSTLATEPVPENVQWRVLAE